jgi:GT2 family glycosyltransferase
MYACIAPNNVRFQDLPLIPLTRSGWPVRRRWERRFRSLRQAAVATAAGAGGGAGRERPFVTVVVANYNGGEFLLRSLRSMVDLDYPPDRREIVLVDDASTDDSLRNACAHFSRELESGALRVVRNPRNLGVAGAYNRGVREADRRAEFILKVDNDLVAAPDALGILVREAIRNPQAGILGGRILEYGEQNRIHYLGGNLVLEPTGKFRFDTPGDLLETAGGAEPRPLDVVNGCMILIRRRVFESIGLWPEFYGRYEYEDYDFALRAKQSGFTSLYCPAAAGHHRVSLSSSSPELSRFRLRQRARNGVIFMHRFAPRSWFPRFLAYHLAKIPLDAVRKGHSPTLLLSGYLEGLRLARRGEFDYPVLAAPPPDLDRGPAPAGTRS